MDNTLSRLKRRINAHGDACDQGQDGGDKRQFQRRGHPLAKDRRDRALKLIGDAKITLNGIANKAQKLHGRRVIQAKLFPQHLAFFNRRFQADHLVYRVPNEAEHHEGDQAHDQHHADRLDQPADGECEHAVRPLLAGEQQRTFRLADRMTCDATKDHLANAALGVGTHDDQVSIKIRGRFQ